MKNDDNGDRDGEDDTNDNDDVIFVAENDVVMLD